MLNSNGKLKQSASVLANLTVPLMGLSGSRIEQLWSTLTVRHFSIANNNILKKHVETSSDITA